MIIDLLEKLIDRLIQLAKYKQELSQEFFSNFVEPTYLEFEAIHQKYLSSFKEYRKLLKDESNSIKYLIDRIKEDQLFGDGQRQKLHALSISNIPTKKTSEFCDSQLLESFIVNIHEYLMNPFQFVNEFDGHKERVFYHQRFYNTLINVLEDHNSKWRTEELIIKEVESMSDDLRKDEIRFCYYSSYNNVLPQDLKDTISKGRVYNGVIDSLDSEYIKNLVIKIKCEITPTYEDMREQCLISLGNMVAQMQDIYGDVSERYFQLRGELLNKYK